MNKRIKSNSIRIIAGQWRGRKLEVLDAKGLRPTTDRVRETLFNWLMHDIPSARCLDLFAGTGILGFESLSRGAAFVQFVELNREAARTISSALSTFTVDAERAQIANTNAEQFLQTMPPLPFDVVFLDPPFADDTLPMVLQRLEQPGFLSESALVYIEQAAGNTDVTVPEAWHLHREGKAGQARYRLYSLNTL